MQKIFLCLASLLGSLGVIFGAFGAHYLKRILPESSLIIFETAVRYQMYHVFALIAVAWALGEFGSPLFLYSGWTFLFGILLFSGSLYLLALTRIGIFGAITPIGGVLFVAGWLLMFLGFLK